MGLTLNEVFGGIGDGGSVPLVIATNDDTLLVTYAAGVLVFRQPQAPTGGSAGLPSLASPPEAPLTLYFSDRLRRIDAVGDSPFGPRQPFDAGAIEKLGVSVLLSNRDAPTFMLTHRRRRFAVKTRLHGRVYVGDGLSFGAALGTVFCFSFGNVS